MIVSYQWLMEYMPVPLPVPELSRILTSIGLEVEAVEPIEAVRGGLAGLVIGEVLTCNRHPNADKLSVTTVWTGVGEPLHIVCGAPNVAAGQRVVVAPVGATVYPLTGDPFQIKKAKIRGEESAGMICAEDEIGLGESHAGIIVLPVDAPVGMLARAYYKIPETDYAIHIGLTPNRADANSHIGVARDVCAYLTHHTGTEHLVKMPKTVVGVADGSKANINASAPVKITINAAEACPRYTGVGISGVVVGESPDWLKRKLQAIGVRSINNVVDVTNYVLHEYGQPLHAFDADKIAGNEIVVTFVPEGTAFKALDGKERTLNAADLTISDERGPLALGGVFGGGESGVSESTTRLFLESAYFTPAFIRRTSLRHNLRTDAATHFEKGVDINNVVPALLRATALIIAATGGYVLHGVTEAYPVRVRPRTVSVHYSYIRKLAGKEYSTESIRNILAALGFGIVAETKEVLTLAIPTAKNDVSLPADIVEEVLRIDGLDNVVVPERLNISLISQQPGDRQQKEKIASLLCGMGLQEIVTNSIVNSKYYPGREGIVKMINSLTSELDVMRPSMLESGLEVVQYNVNRKNSSLALFEFGNVYAVGVGKYIQEQRLALWITGNVTPPHWERKAQPADVYYLKGIVNNIFSYLGIRNVPVKVADDGTISWERGKLNLGSVNRVATARLQEFDVKQAVCFADLYWDNIMKAAAASNITYREITKYPAVQRDLALVLDSAVSYQDVEMVTALLKINALQQFRLFDVFEHEKLGKNKKSYAINYTFQSADRTLTDPEIEQMMTTLIEAYKNKLNAQIRE